MWVIVIVLVIVVIGPHHLGHGLLPLALRHLCPCIRIYIRISPWHCRRRRVCFEIQSSLVAQSGIIVSG
jgi:hypothetical protein